MRPSGTCLRRIHAHIRRDGETDFKADPFVCQSAIDFPLSVSLTFLDRSLDSVLVSLSLFGFRCRCTSFQSVRSPWEHLQPRCSSSLHAVPARAGSISGCARGCRRRQSGARRPWLSEPSIPSTHTCVQTAKFNETTFNLQQHLPGSVSGQVQRTRERPESPAPRRMVSFRK